VADVRSIGRARYRDRHFLFAIAIGILGGAGFLAQKNLRGGRGDLPGATRLGVCMAVVLMAVWLCRVHLVGSIGLRAADETARDARLVGLLLREHADDRGGSRSPGVVGLPHRRAAVCSTADADALTR
jgi:hypothetical protein